MKWLKKNISTIILGLVFLVGLSLLLYPSVSDYWNSLHQSHAIAGYTESVTDMKKETYEKLWKEAEEYNKKLLSKADRWNMKGEEEEYESLLNVTDNGIMCYIDIPKIKTMLPVYHGVDDAVLQVAIGHIGGSSLPVGGESTHCVLSGHRGLPSAKLFTNLDKLEEGDYFMLHTLQNVLTYEVDQILIVEPEELSSLEIQEGEDLCTLVTCTPYGVNSHRLLVRGHRVANLEGDASGIMADAVKVDTFLVVFTAVIPVLGLVLCMFLYYRKRRGKKCEKRDE